MSPRLRLILYWALAAVFIADYIRLHIAAGFSLPVPWPDESSFLWQAISVARHGTLFAPELNTLREVMWMPPGYMIVLGLVFKLFGASLMAARTVSLVCMVGVFWFIADAVRRRPFSFIVLSLLGLAFLSSSVVVAGNTARMDAMLLCLGALSFWLFGRRRDAWALAVAAISPLIHPNGLFLFAVALGYVSTHRGWRRLAASGRAWILVGASIALWTAYTVYVGGRWDAFQSDMTYQMVLKGGNEFPLFNVRSVLFLGSCVGIILYGRRRGQSYPLDGWFGVGMWIVYAIGTDTWYECFFAVAIVLLGGAAIPIVLVTSRTWFHGQAMWQRNAAVGALLAFMAICGYHPIWNRDFFNPALVHGWYGLRAEEPGVPYITPGDKARVAEFLRSLQSPPRAVLVQFHPEADALFFADMENDSLRFCQGTFFGFAPDIYIVRTSRYIPDWYARKLQGDLTAMHMSRDSGYHMLVERDSTESVVVYEYPYARPGAVRGR